MTKEELLRKNAAIRLAREQANKNKQPEVVKEPIVEETINEPTIEEVEEKNEIDTGSKREEVKEINEEDIIAIEEVDEEEIPAEAEVIEAVDIKTIEQPRKRKGGKKPANRRYMVVDDAEVLEEETEVEEELNDSDVDF